jgi:hypothetical protein
VNALAQAAAIYAVVVALWCVIAAVSGRKHPPLLDACLAVAAIVAVVVALVGAVDMLRGEGPAEPGVHVAYLVVMASLLPVAATWARAEQGPRWSSATLAIAALTLAVVLTRSVATS